MKTALVTGANGHLGTSLTQLLVQSGYQVRASMRGTNDLVKSGPLRKLGVEVVEADVLDPAALERACEGMDAVFHLAAVFRFVVADPQRDLIDPAVKGAEHLLRAAKKAGVKRVVMTSSTVAIGIDHHDRPLDERDWNDGATNPYGQAKTRAERRAWELSKELALDLVCINPSAILGPGFMRHTPITFSIETMLKGELPVALPFVVTYVDCRDVARAHLLALETAGASGRYIVCGESFSNLALARLLKELRPKAKLPSWEMPAWLLPMARLADWGLHQFKGAPRQLSADVLDDFTDGELRFSCTRAQQELGWSARPLRETLEDTAKWIEEHKVPAW